MLCDISSDKFITCNRDITRGLVDPRWIYQLQCYDFSPSGDFGDFSTAPSSSGGLLAGMMAGQPLQPAGVTSPTSSVSLTRLPLLLYMPYR